MVPNALHVVMVEPDAVRHGEIGSEQSEILQMRSLRLAVAFEADHHLHLGFLHMAVQADIEFARQRGALAHEIVGAMMWDRWGDGGTNGRAIEFPTLH